MAKQANIGQATEQEKRASLAKWLDCPIEEISGSGCQYNHAGLTWVVYTHNELRQALASKIELKLKDNGQDLEQLFLTSDPLNQSIYPKTTVENLVSTLIEMKQEASWLGTDQVFYLWANNPTISKVKELLAVFAYLAGADE